MDFKIPGLPHSTVELIQKIENHPNRHALQRDLQQSQSYNPFSQASKEMVHEVGNIELCELLDIEPKTQCPECLSYWDLAIVWCTCGHFWRIGTEENKKFVQYTIDILSIPQYYSKKGRPHGQNMIDNGRTEESCRQMDEFADEDHTHHLTPEEIEDYRVNWWIRSYKIGSDTMPIRQRSDFKQAFATVKRTKKMKLNATNSSSLWSWQGSWCHSSYENHHKDVPQHRLIREIS